MSLQTAGICQNNTINRKLTGETKAAVSVWVLAIGYIIELRGLQEEINKKKSKGKRISPGKNKVLTGVWLETIGQILVAVGVTKQLKPGNNKQKDVWIKLAIKGNWLKSFGAALVAIGETEDHELKKICEEFFDCS